MEKPFRVIKDLSTGGWQSGALILVASGSRVVGLSKILDGIDPRNWRARAKRLAAGGLVLAVAATAAVASHSETGAGVLKVRLGGDAKQTRLVIELDHPAQGKLLSGDDATGKVLVALPRVNVPGDMQGGGAGLIVIDFIDMDEGKNNRAVEKKLKDLSLIHI